MYGCDNVFQFRRIARVNHFLTNFRRLNRSQKLQDIKNENRAKSLSFADP